MATGISNLARFAADPNRYRKYKGGVECVAAVKEGNRQHSLASHGGARKILKTAVFIVFVLLAIAWLFE